MKRFLLLSLAVILSGTSYSQHLISATYKRSYTTIQIDSIYNSLGLPQGILPNQYPVKLYKIVYNTVAVDSVTPTIASGLMVVPDGNMACKLSLMMYAHGTVHLKTGVPSNEQAEYIVGIACAAAGYVAALPDYLGLGDSPGMHPYIHARSEATACIDMIRASKEAAAQLNKQLSGQVFLTGYSQGGHASMATHKWIQNHFSSEFDVSAAVPMSGPYSLSHVMKDLILSNTPYSNPNYLPYVILSFRYAYNIYPNLSDVFIAPYDTLLPPLFQGLNGGGAIDAIMPSIPKLILQPALLDTFELDSNHIFRKLLKESDLYDWKPMKPTTMLYCEADEQVSYLNTIEAYNFMNSIGAPNVYKLSINPTLGHVDCARYAMLYMRSVFDSLRYDKMQFNSTIQNPTEFGATNGSIDLYFTGGKPPYTYNWSNGFTGQDPTGLGAGQYTVIVTDALGCQFTSNYTLNNPFGIENQTNDEWIVFPNPVKEVLYVKFADKGFLGGNVSMVDVHGRLIYNQKLTSENFEIQTANLAKGLYMITLHSTNGKSLHQKIIIGD
jgi:hypothetical protein